MALDIDKTQITFGSFHNHFMINIFMKISKIPSRFDIKKNEQGRWGSGIFL